MLSSAFGQLCNTMIITIQLLIPRQNCAVVCLLSHLFFNLRDIFNWLFTAVSSVFPNFVLFHMHLLYLLYRFCYNKILYEPPHLRNNISPFAVGDIPKLVSLRKEQNNAFQISSSPNILLRFLPLTDLIFVKP